MTKLEEIEKEIARVREIIDNIACDEVKQLIDELEYLLHLERKEFSYRLLEEI